MSASRMPTDAPSAASASARLTAVVLLPTPPLPEATATMFFTLGSNCTPRCTACATILLEMLTLTFSTPCTERAASIRRRRNASTVDIAGHLAAFDPQVAQLLGGDEIAARFRIDDTTQGIEQRGFLNGHGGVDTGAAGVATEASAAVATRQRSGRSEWQPPITKICLTISACAPPPFPPPMSPFACAPRYRV